ncbi:phosphodiester glycosidase family protein [Chondromyces crocatus]|uniref:Phosphodiester glycosidase domain-containing protein n=1 Tax=Chondromyces crocatus TaxID=52 RepID=A0A0K1EJC3_CHOCO|nr:phosphodiester glycosidase family protein [Chondromyces crocatus]AKT40964.1 uncharacterized protein CMC5_051210 [Chondromyces crocatus]
MGGVGIVVTGGLWYAIHQVPGFAPAVVDGVRAVVGPEPIAWIEDVAYGMADRVNQLRYGTTPPKTFWEEPALPTEETEEDAILPASVTVPVAASERAAPLPFTPPYKKVATAADGTWIPIAHADDRGGDPILWKSVVHPDPRRGFAAVAVVAIDLRAAEIRLVAGTQEPVAVHKLPDELRPGVVPQERTDDLLAAFNGGFKAMHGNYGMMLDGVKFLPPRKRACTIAFHREGGVRIRTWSALKADAPSFTSYRQTPPCLVEQGNLNAGLSESNRNWGSTVSGETIIRRSALGIDETGRFMFYGLGEAVSSETMGRAMKTAGAHDAAQLDVNHAYPRFLLYTHGVAGEPPIAESSLIPDVNFKATEYVTDPSPRDFFYVARRKTAS